MAQLDYRLRVIGKNIRKIREQNNYTIEYVAELAEISPAHLQRVETFKKGISLSCLYRIADFFDVSIDVLLREDIGFVGQDLQLCSKTSQQEENFIEELMQHVRVLKEKYQI